MSGLSREVIVEAALTFALSKSRKERADFPGADRILNNAVLYDGLAAAIADCTFVLATTARNHDQAKPVKSSVEDYLALYEGEGWPAQTVTNAK